MNARFHPVNLRVGPALQPSEAEISKMHRKPITFIALLGAAACSGGQAVDPSNHDMHSAESLRLVSANSPEVNSGLAEIRRGTAKFHDFEKAIEAGYTAWSPNPLVVGSTCPTSAEGNMGYHLVNV